MVKNQYKEKYPLLFSVERPSDIKHFSEKELAILSSQLRNYIIDVVSVRQGHLGSNLGVVELTVALHYVFDTPSEPLVWDVGHQAYAHKILCCRRDAFLHLRELGGISGFPRREESPYDAFGTGHSSTSISAVVGMAFADAVQGVKKNHIAVIGDASIASGMALEAMNYASGTDINVLIILNDNAMGIDPSTGALARHFMELRKGTAMDNFFHTLGIPYYKVNDGHDIHELIDALTAMSKMSGVRILHVPTIKGKGYPAAEEEQTLYHYPGVFDRKTGQVNPLHTLRYQDIVGKKLLALAQKDPKVYALTPAMPTSSGLSHMAHLLPQRVINTGIAESHTITMAAGMAVGGLKPFAVVYSTFLQRAYDQIIHDVAIQNLPVRFLIDRAGIVGADGATHHGIFDLAYLLPIPNITILAPMDGQELEKAILRAYKTETPVAVRYPRGNAENSSYQSDDDFSHSRLLKKGTDVAVISVGDMGLDVEKAIALLDDTEKTKVAHYDLRIVKPLDENTLKDIFSSFSKVITVENGIISGGAGENITAWATQHGYQSSVIKNMGVDDFFPSFGTTEQIKEQCKICINDIVSVIKNCLEKV